MSYSFKIVSQLTQQSPLIAQWQSLQADCIDANFYHDWRWHFALKTHLLPTMQWVVGYHDDSLISVVPIEHNEQTGIVSLPSHSQIDLFDVTLNQNHLNIQWLHALFGFFSAEFQHWKRFSVRPVLKTSAMYQLYEQYSGLTHNDPYLKNTFFNVSDAKALAKLSKKHLKNINRLSRKLTNDVSEPTFEHACPLPNSLDVFLAIEDSSWKGQPGENTSIRKSAALSAFYKQVANAFNETGDCFICLCNTNNEYIAGQFALRTQNRLSMVKIGYNAKFHQYAPGNLLLAETLAFIAHSPINEVNLVTGPSWADRWHPLTQTVHWLTFYNNTFGSKCDYWWAHIKDKLRPIANKVRNKAVK
ncbi:GNAT family N-acetyltransferase [Reinekea marina]|uniref:GNAT family N-acetyltransferase n=1 Tax=Reinekea marina TaxID=1310421 RepID=A0ABV7WS02_9GAMM|nr:GNAT family N-acetyltransferase [Reinekea marina]MDN3648146.1 GNAT family N-acetyltransferase [Reinekea marina]